MFVITVLENKGFDIFSVSPDDTLLTVLRLFGAKKIGFAVVKNRKGNVLGGISERDICNAISAAEGSGGQSPVKDAMDEDIMTCGPQDNLVKIMALMTEKKNRHVLVVDDDGLRGVISIGDVVKHRLDEIMREEQEMINYVEGTGYSYGS